MKVHFSNLAAFKLQRLVDYLLEEWGEQSKRKFLKQLDIKIKVIETAPRAFPASRLDPKLRKCVVTKQTTILYEVHDQYVFILNLIDTRQDPMSIWKEIKKNFG
jgi:plasmid stabilization system protein ParE